MRINAMIFMLMLMVFTGCSKYEFDGFDPGTTTVKWLIKGVSNE